MSISAPNPGRNQDDEAKLFQENLEKSGQLDNTLVVFTSDNGYLMGEHGLFDNKRWAWEPSIRLPLVARYPKLISQRNSCV